MFKSKSVYVTWLMTGVVGALMLALVLVISFKTDPAPTTGYAGLETNITNSIRDEEYYEDVMEYDSYLTLIELYETYPKEDYNLGLVYVIYHFEKNETGYVGFGVDFQRKTDQLIFSNIFSSEYLDDGKLVNMTKVG